MSEAVIADFQGKFMVDADPEDTPVQGRVVLSQKRLVLAGSAEKVTIPLASVFDIGVGEVPPDVAEFFNDTVTVGFRRGGETHAAAIEASSDDIERFGTVLYKARLNGVTVAVRHPARVGGRVTNASLERGSLRVTHDGLVCETDTELEIALEGVVHFEKLTREIEGTSRPVLAVRHAEGSQMVTSELALASEDRMNVLGRFLRRRYVEIMAEVRDISLGDTETEILVGIYSGGGGADFARMLDIDSGQVSMVLNDLTEKGLVSEDGERLTPRGMVVVSDHIEDVNV